MAKVKVTITAEDGIGREESITLMLDPQTAGRLEKAANCVSPTERADSALRREINGLIDYGKDYGYLSLSQYRRLSDFDDLIYHKFYNYDLSVDVKW